MSKIGYKNPPKHSQFQKGRSGNFAGRPKGSKNTLKLLNEVLEQKIVITQEGKQVKISKKLAMLMQLVNSAVKGELKSIAALLPYMLQLDLKEEERVQAVEALSQDDAEILRLFIEKNRENKDE